jgi:chorismate dehydratase
MTNDRSSTALGAPATAIAAPTASRHDVIRVGAVSFTNTLPLIEGLDDPRLRERHGYEMVLRPPRRLAEMLAADELDIALIPTVEFLRGDYRLLTTSCISCLGPVRSVAVVGERGTIGACERVQLDNASRTSNALTRLLFTHLWRGTAEFVDAPHEADAPPTPGRLPADCDAAVVIGDRALRLAGAFSATEDLGAAWFELTNLPFVFAVWAVRPGVDLRDLPGLFCASNRLGRDNIAAIARDRAADMGLPQEFIFSYLTEFVRFRIGDRELAGIEMFYRLLRDAEEVPELDRLKFYPHSAC